MSFSRILGHLLPSGRAWKLAAEKLLTRLIDGLAGGPEDARVFIDEVFEDLWPDTTRELPVWELQFGLPGTGTELERRSRLTAAWRATGGQSPRYLQDVLQAAGFDVYLHEWWSSGPPWVARDPRSYTDQPLIGTTQHGEPLAQCGEPSATHNAFLANDPGYLVNLDLTRRAPAPVPEDPDTWPYFLYVGGETFPDRAEVLASRRAEFEELLLRLFPAQQWLVTRVTYTTSGGDTLTTLGGDTLTTLGGDTLVTLGG